MRQSGIWLNLSQEIKRTLATNKPLQKHGAGDFSVSFYIFLVEILVLVVNISRIMIRKWEEEKNIRLELEKDKIEMELSFLKSQINPHFFFNSLNTVNALTYTDIEQSRNALKTLGKIMRYVLYNTSSECSTLSKEIEFIRNYLELMKMRLPQRVSIDFSTNITSINRRIAPMLFLSLIENCFKHGVSTQVDSPVFIRIEEEDQYIIFHSKNKVFERTVDNETGDIQNHGIGIKNTRRRLELLYPNKYSLSIKRGDTFEILLKITLNENKMCNG
jgi:sensor histidine kinase YesM